jgi:hypothetical protein
MEGKEFFTSFKKMVKNLSATIFELRELSFLLFTYAYFGINADIIFYSPYFNYANFFLTILITLIAEVVFKKITKNSNNWLRIFLLTIFIFVFFGFYISSSITLLSEHFNYQWIRLRYIIAVFLLLLIIFKKHNAKIIYFINIFILIIGTISLFTKLFTTERIELQTYYPDTKNIKITNENKPIILIILDEYHSPDEIYKITKDSSAFLLSSFLKTKGWKVRNTSISLEKSTIHSIGSIFNFNISKLKDYNKLTAIDIGANFLNNNLLIDSLKNKNVTFHNLGIFNISGFKPINNLYHYPYSFYQTLYLNSGARQIFENLNFDSKNLIMSLNTKSSNWNKFLFSYNDFDKGKSFSLIHFFMPHIPYFLEDEFTELKYGKSNYIAYWNFTNRKFINFLNNEEITGKFKIILTGDHGFRIGRPFNHKNTFTAFYGFKNEELNSISTVQDIGFLINANFIKLDLLNLIVDQ